MDLTQLSALDAAAAIREGDITSEELVQACLGRIDEAEPSVQAWAHLDAEHALGQARSADDLRRKGEPLGPLHGVPVGVKDIFDTADFPTEDGTVLHAGQRRARDATAVTRLREAGAVILGKTVTTELALYAPGKTRNPHDPERTPGGSSSGSAAAVASGMVPLAIGSQTNGSIIRPASFCGVVGYKPSHGLISRHRVLQLSRHLDTVGVFARTVADAALIADSLIGYDEMDPDTRPCARYGLAERAVEEPPVTPRLALVRTQVWDQADGDTREAFEELLGYLDDCADEFVLPEPFADAWSWHRIVMESDLAYHLEKDYETGKDKLSSTLCEMIERGRTYTAVEYQRAIERAELLNPLLERLFERWDVIFTPAAPGEAPVGLGSTGSPVFCSLWTYLGTPAISVPLLQGSNGMPMGVQLVAPKGDDVRLLRTARWLAERVSQQGDAAESDTEAE